jgi:hypothetical protein
MQRIPKSWLHEQSEIKVELFGLVVGFASASWLSFVRDVLYYAKKHDHSEGVRPVLG